MDLLIKKGLNKVTCFIENFNLSSGRYVLGFAIDKPNVRWYYYNLNVLGFFVEETMNGNLKTLPIYSHLYLDHRWIIQDNKE